MKKILRRNEFYIALTILLLGIIIQTTSGQFFTANNFVDLARSLIVPGMLCVGVMMILVSGNIDVSFPAISMLSMYAVVKGFEITGYQGPVFAAFILSGLIGLFLGAINGILAAWLKLPTLIITLGTGSVYLGFMQGVLKSSVISVLPKPIANLSKAYLFTVHNAELGVSSSLSVMFVLLPLAALSVALIMRYTMLGRGIYAIGGDIISAQRAGFRVPWIQIFVFSFMGALAGVVGMTRVTLTGMCQPTTLIGIEMTCIASVVLGGVRITGGHGTVTGALLGALLLTMISNSLILLGIPSYWTKFATGVLIVVGIGITAYQALRADRRVMANILQSDAKPIPNGERDHA